MVLKILRDIANSIRDSGNYNIMADEPLDMYKSV